MRWQMGLVVSWLVLGCAPSRETATAGQIGCQPSEITITDGESSSGFAASNETWLAECQGRIFVCSKTTSSGFAYNSSGESTFGSGSSQISCREKVEAPSEAKTVVAPRPSVASNAAPTESTPPKGAAGFDFGLSAAAAQAACQGAGKIWNAESAEVATCSGATTKLGFDAFVSLKFCADAACFISLRVTDTENWSGIVGDLRTKLSQKYGEPRSTTALPSECATPASFTQCFKEGDHKLRYGWSWLSGEQLLLLVGKPSPEAAASIRVQYKREAATMAVDAAGL